MEKTLWKSHWWAYAQTNWLKIVVFGILCFIFLKKDLTFQLNLNAPLQPVGEIDEWTIKSYIERFSQVAITEQERFQIPASIILANGIFHSFAGQREISAWESFRDHSYYLNQGKFKNLKRFEITDYKAWAKGLEKLQYGEQLKMSYQLIQLIEQHKLYQFDLAGI